MDTSFSTGVARGLPSAALALLALAALAGPARSEPVRLAQTNGMPPPVAYQQGTGFYAAIGLGAAWPSSTNIRTRNLDSVGLENVNGDLDFGGGFSGDVALGYDFGAIRTELSYVYTRSSLNNVSFNNTDFSSSGAINKNDVFASAYWDVGTGSRWTPYIGGGVGYTNLSTPRIKISQDGESLSSGGVNRGLFGWQAKLGVSYGVSNSTDVYVEGTYSGAQGFSGENIRYDAYNDFGAKLGARVRFGGAPAAEPVVAAPQPQPAPVYTPEPAPAPMPEPEPVRGLW